MLTPREKEVMELIALGFSNSEVAEKLVISMHTVKAHKEKIYEKLDVHNEIQAVRKYLGR